MTSPDRRFPRRVYREGAEPDVRFTLANERTFLAWIRTSLALLAGGVALEALALGLQPGFRLAASIVLIVTGIAAPAQAWFGWMRVERALRLDRPLPAAGLSLPLGIAVVVAGVLVLLGVLTA
ncbi:YidH family protein [Clavibacter zhangzhiyongii]|jgi:putative membrane protein|uniref:YidH family protein n=1 Tax=Clavibacter zhangzhiyongii TaxID=2768071 RepID=UPI0039DF47D9